MYSIIKRDGKVVDFDLSKISGAIEKAFIAQKREYNKQIIDMLALNAVSDSEKKAVDGKVDVESIQDSVPCVLPEGGGVYVQQSVPAAALKPTAERSNKT